MEFYKNIDLIGIFLMSIGFLFFIEPVLSQDNVGNLISEQLEKADSIFSESKKNNSKIGYEKADSIYQFAKVELIRQKDWLQLFSSIKGEWRILFAEREIEKGIDSLNKYLKIIPKDQEKIHADIRRYLSYNYFINGEYLKSIQIDKEVIQLFKKLDDTLLVKKSYKNLSLAYSRIGDDQSAIKIAKEGMDYVGDHSNIDLYMDLKSNIGIFHFYREEYQEAKKELMECVEYFKNDDRTKVYLAKANIKLGEFEKARSYLDKVFSYSGSTKEFESGMYELHNAQGAYELALNHQEKVVAFTKSEIEERMYLKEISKLALLQWEMGLKEDAFETAHDALCKHFDDLDSSNIHALPNVEEFVPETWVIESAFIKANYYASLIESNSNLVNETNASFYFDLIFQMYDKLKGNYINLDSKYKMGTYSQSMYDNAINFYLSLYKKYNKKDFFDKALQVTQLSNAYVLRSSVSERQALEDAMVPSNEMNKYFLLKNKLSEASVDGNESLVDSIIFPFNKLMDSLELNHPSFKLLKESKILQVENIQSEIEEDELVIKYHFTEQELIGFVVSKYEFSTQVIKLDAKSYEQISDFKHSLRNSENSIDEEQESGFCKLSKNVYDLILEPILNKSKYSKVGQLYIIPDGPLKSLSFNALMYKQTESWSDPQSYLIDKYNVSYLYYLSQIKNLETQQITNNSFIGFGVQYQDANFSKIVEQYFNEYQDSLNTTVTRSASLKPLNNADDEVINIARLLGGKFFIDDGVTLSNVRANINNARIVHFAVHTLVDPEDFKKSFVLLSGNENNQYELGYKEILNLGANNELTVLSACQTGIGQEIDGEGVMSLSRAFSFSGSKSTMGSYWNVPDKASMIMMELFYANLKNGYSKSESLRQAQIQYMSDDSKTSPFIRAPFYWAGWTIYGNNDTLKIQNGFFTRPILIGTISLLILIILLAYLIKKRQK